MEASASTMSLKRFHQAGREVDLSPSLDITFDDAVNSCPDFFPGFGMIGMAQPPFRCVTVNKELVDVETRKGISLKHWVIQLRASGQSGIVVLRANLVFVEQYGLWKYEGDSYGVSFVWRRFDPHFELGEI
jgi:hypothetical protein